MLIFIQNTPRAYAWGSREALPELLGTTPTGEPQAELWLGAHPGAPATVAKAVPDSRTLIDLIESDPQQYGVDGGQLPFLLKVLAIGSPLSLQVHPNKQQAELGFAAEEAAGIPASARNRNYGDPNHKPELLVALSEVSALSGFRPIEAAVNDLLALAGMCAGDGLEQASPRQLRGAEALTHAAQMLGRSRSGTVSTPEERRQLFLEWALGESESAATAVAAIATAVRAPVDCDSGAVDRHRLAVLRQLVVAYPDDAGMLVSLLLHLVRLQPGEAIFLGAQQLHAYLGGIAVEIMAASDNVLRAGFTEKYVDAPELLRILSFGELADPRFAATPVAPGLVAWEPGVPDFRLLRARLCEPEEPDVLGRAVLEDEPVANVVLSAEYPLVVIVTSGRIRVERPEAEFDEVASVRRGQSLYVSAGSPVELSGSGEVFIASVGCGWGSAGGTRG